MCNLNMCVTNYSQHHSTQSGVQVGASVGVKHFIFSIFLVRFVSGELFGRSFPLSTFESNFGYSRPVGVRCPLVGILHEQNNSSCDFIAIRTQDPGVKRLEVTHWTTRGDWTNTGASYKNITY